MKRFLAAALFSQAALAFAPWWDGAPDCAQDCFSSWWSSSTAWPTPTAYCSASQGASVSSCLAASCSATPTAVTSYSSLSSSLCAQWSSCSSAGSTGVYTVTAPEITAAAGTWPNRLNHWGGGPDNDNDNDPNDDDDDDDDDDDWSWKHTSRYNQWTRTWSGGAYTVTGCEFDNSPWAGGPFGFGPGSGPGPNSPSRGPWAPWGKGWTWHTVTRTITRVVTVSAATASVTGTWTGTDSIEPGVVLSTSVGVEVLALAESDGITSTSVVGSGAQATGTGTETGTGTGSAATGAATGTSGAVGGKEGLGVKVCGAVLGGLVVVVAVFL